MKFSDLGAVGVMGVVEVQLLILTGCRGIDDHGRGACERRPELGPIRTEVGIGISHGKRAVPEVDEHTYAMTGSLNRRGSVHIALHHKNEGMREASLGSR